MGKRLIDLVMDRDEDFLYEDDRAMKLTTAVMVQRCVQAEMAGIFKDKSEGDVDTLAHLLENGFKGFGDMEPSYLIEEYQAMEDKWYVELCMKTLLHIHMVQKHLGGWWCCLTFHDHLSCRQHPACENF